MERDLRKEEGIIIKGRENEMEMEKREDRKEKIK